MRIANKPRLFTTIAISICLAGVVYLVNTVKNVTSTENTKDITKAYTEQTKLSLTDISRDIKQMNDNLNKEVKYIYVDFKKSVSSLAPDGLILSVDEFIGRWRRVESTH